MPANTCLNTFEVADGLASNIGSSGSSLFPPLVFVSVPVPTIQACQTLYVVNESFDFLVGAIMIRT